MLAILTSGFIASKRYIMNEIDLNSYRVPELCESLQERTVNCSLSKTIEHVWLCKFTVELNLEYC